MQNAFRWSASFSAGLVATLVAAAPLHGRQEPRAVTPYESGHTWFSRDKIYHFSASGAAAAGVYVATRELGVGRRNAVASAVFLVGAAGVLREILDREDPGNLLTRQQFSRRDMVWNGVGIGIGITLPDRLLRERWPAARRSRAKRSHDRPYR
jgi:uncharacterized protein YfiM (DUF2279 family)